MSVCSAPLSTSIYPTRADLTKYRYREQIEREREMLAVMGCQRLTWGKQEKRGGKSEGEKAEKRGKGS